MTIDQINAICPGWSGDKQWDAFDTFLRQLPVNAHVLMLGVYQGRDIAYMHTIAKQLGKRIRITGVDLFSDVPGADWQEADKGKSWQDAHGVDAPSLNKARFNIEMCGAAPCTTLIQANALTWLESHAADAPAFHMAYIDLSHDYETTRDAIKGVVPLIVDGGIIAGDDYSDEGTWGVKRAVSEAFPSHGVSHAWIWSAYKGAEACVSV